MLSLNIISHTAPESAYEVISRKLSIDTDRSIALLISTKEWRLLHLLEEGMLEILAGLTWNSRDMTNDFSFVMERYNKFLINIGKTDDISDVHMFLGVTLQNTLVFSTLWQIEVKLIERGGRITDIGESVAGSSTEFTNISSGAIPLESAVCVANIPLLSLLSRDDLDELAQMEDDRFETVGQELLTREMNETIHCIRFSTERLEQEKSSVFLEKWAHHMNKVKGYTRDMLGKMSDHPLMKKVTNPITNLQDAHQKRIQIGVFIVGALFCIGLLWILFQNIFSFTQTTTQDNQASITEITSLIDKAEKDRANTTLFNQDIREAEALLAPLRDNPQYIKSVKELSDRIVALKKEVNGIETVNIGSKTSIIPVPDTGFTLIGGFTSDTTNLSYAVGKEGMIGPYNEGATGGNVITYPPGEIAKSAEITSEGLLYIIMESGHIFVQDTSTSELVSVSVVWQEGWEKADMMKSFDGKLYLVTRSPAEILRHTSRPNTSFSAKSVLYSSSGTLSDVAIDGAAYVLGNDGKITKVIAWQTDIQAGIVLNGIPWEYTVGSGGSIFVRPNLSFFYVMSGKNIWIFTPDSRNFRDLQSLTYVTQIEVTSDTPIVSYFVPRDGKILVTTTKWIYSVDFQISDTAENKIVLDDPGL